MLGLRKTATKTRSLPCLQRLYSTKEITKGVEPIQSFENKDGITEVYVIHHSDAKGLKKPLSRRLNALSALKDDKDWTEVSKDKKYERVHPPQNVDVANLAHGLEKVLFNPGVHYLKDPRTKTYNFTPYLENITQPLDFDFEALQPYITSSRDNSLIDLAKKMKKRYVGSTSSTSAVLSHLYFVMSNFKQINTSCLSNAFRNESRNFTRGTRVASSIYLRWKDGVYAVDVDKSYDVDETVLSVMGKSLEKVLTLEPEIFKRYLKENSDSITEEEKNRPESYAYGQLGKFLLRSQLDCFDSRLPRGTFDLKTRAAMPVRLDIRNYTDYLGYSLKRAHGLYESFEREYYDMIRSAFLKYSFQVRMGHMDGILVAYHNTRKIFGFQYISREEMDSRLFGSTKIGDEVFRNSLVILESILDKATQKYPEQTLRLSFDTKLDKKTLNASTNIFVEAVPSEDSESAASASDIDLDEFFQTEDQETKALLEPHDKLSMYKLDTQSFVNGQKIEGPLRMKNPAQDVWRVRTSLKEELANNDTLKRNKFRAMRNMQAQVYAPAEKNSNPMLKKFKSMSDAVLRQEGQSETGTTTTNTAPESNEPLDSNQQK